MFQELGVSKVFILALKGGAKVHDKIIFYDFSFLVLL